MTTDDSWADTWEPGNRVGFVTSIVSVLFLAVLFWWFGVLDSGTSVGALSDVERAVALSLGVLLGGGGLALHARRAWRERWRTSRRLRVLVAAPLFVSVGLLLVLSPAVVSLGFVVMAIVFIPGRTVLYLLA